MPPGLSGTSVRVAPHWAMAPGCSAPSCRAAARQEEQGSTEAHLRQPFPLRPGDVPGLPLRGIRFISEQKDHSSVLDTFLQKKQSKAPWGLG